MLRVLICWQSVLIVLGERHAETSVDGTEDDGVGEHLDKVRLAGREAEEDTRGEDNEEDDRDENVGVEHLYVAPNFFSEQNHIA